MEEVECSVCRKDYSRKSCRGIHVRERGVQYVCSSCRKLPFDEVMDTLSFGTVYIRGTHYKNILEMEKMARGENVK
jgi:hypothetical protein